MITYEYESQKCTDPGRSAFSSNFLASNPGNLLMLITLIEDARLLNLQCPLDKGELDRSVCCFKGKQHYET